MKRLPLFPTLLTFVMLTVLISLGIWQLERRAWKHELIRQLEAAQSLPPLEPADFLATMTRPTSAQYRRAELPCSPGTVLPYDLKGGSSAGGESGYLLLVFACVVWLRRRRSAHRSTRLAFTVMMAALLVQVLIGIATVLSAAALHVALTHQVAAVVLWVLILRARYLSQYPRAGSIRKGTA